MWWFVRVYVDGGEHYNCSSYASSQQQAEFFARRMYKNEGEIVVDCEAEPFDTFSHGDPNDYEIAD